MPLVVFNYDSATDGLMVDGEFRETLDLPRWAHDKKWTLHAVNAVYMNALTEDFRMLEVSFPEIMNTQEILFSNVVSGEAIDVPGDTFRFYANRYQLSENVTTRNPSVFGVLSEYPNLVLGTHRLETSRITCVIRPRNGNVSSGSSEVNSVCIILSFEE